MEGMGKERPTNAEGHTFMHRYQYKQLFPTKVRVQRRQSSLLDSIQDTQEEAQEEGCVGGGGRDERELLLVLERSLDSPIQELPSLYSLHEDE